MDVLVVGAGPVGLMAAHELLRRGVSIRIVDAAPGPATTSRAAAIHARTMELFDQIGLYPAFAARGVRCPGIAFHADGKRLASMDTTFTAHATRFNHALFLDQVLHEELLRDAVTALGGQIEWGVRLTGLAEGDDRVVATLAHANGRTERISTPWLVGADGGHSRVRTELGVRLTGDSTETWLVADAELDFAEPFADNRIAWIRADGTTMMIFPLVGDRRWRLLDTVDIDYDGNPDTLARRFTDKLVRGLGVDVRVRPPTWVSVFTIQQRVAPTMQSRRCFLAGDAAHVHSPASGQGLNTGLQDAINLAWKLAAVLLGDADPVLLRTYSAERVPVGRALLASTRMATMMVGLRNPVVDEHLPAVFATLAAVPPVLQAINQGFLGGMSGLGIAYPTSPLTVHDTDITRPGPTPGQRVTQVGAAAANDPGWQVVLAGLRHTDWTLLGGADATLTGPSWATPVPVRDGAATDLGIGTRGWLLVRPDGYVAARGHDQTELDTALRRLPL